MGRFARLVREITPAWLNPRSARHVAADTSPSAADASWQDVIDNKMYGADTPDYSHIPEQPVSDARRPAGDRPASVKDLPRLPRKPNPGGGQ
ncbi:hypothetical protein ACFSOZ_28570 [Mesorhizobium newzealandense]|uniref:Uncharacterized protein n=1 Tax=Mesorhizobium newzealandense TaxID=1300302 RepID=A0ABW4UJ90_9HYPH